MTLKKVVQDSSGIVGLFNVEQAAQNIYLAMHAIQHRGQDGVGLAISDGENVVCKKGLGLLSENLKQDTLNSLEGNIAIGQLRMATKNDSQLENVQPIMVRSHQRYFAVVSSGMITNAISLRTKLENEGLIFQGTSDSELLAHLIQLNPGSFEEKIAKACRMMSGAYTFMVITKDSLYVVRDPHGIRSLYIAKVDEGYCISSETCSFPILGGEFIREVNPGELICFNCEGMKSSQIIEETETKACALEYVYYSRPDSVHNGLTVHEVRKQCGRDFIIDVRISGDEYSDGGLTLNDMIYVSKQLEKATVDFIHVSGGNTIKKGSSMPASGTAPAPHKHASEEIKKHVSIPVATVSRINEPWVADELIANGVCDACMIGRPNLCDSEFANKAKAGKTDEIRPCIGCGRCLTGIMFGKPISCTVNPAVEKEEIDEAPVKKKVLVVGGGPAGMEAAYVAKKRGHEVVLCEQSDRLGGQLNIACVPIGKQEITKVVKYMKSQLTGVDVRLNTTVTKEMIENEFKDYEVITTVGATPKEIEPYKVFKQTMTADDILSGKKFPGRKIVIIGGGSVGCETADYLAPLINDLFPTNRDITLIEMTKGLMTGESGATKSLLTRRMMEKGVKIELNSKITYVDENTIKYEKNHQEYVLDDVDTLVFAVGYNPVASPIENAHLIGDCQKVGTLKDAITNAYQITKEI